MTRTMTTMSPMSAAEQAHYTDWLATHLPEARRRARRVSWKQAAEGLPANTALGLPAIRPMGVDPKTIERTEKREPSVRRSEKLDKMIDWVREYLGNGPEACPSGCPVCKNAPPQKGGRKPSASR